MIMKHLRSSQPVKNNQECSCLQHHIWAGNNNESRIVNLPKDKGKVLPLVVEKVLLESSSSCTKEGGKFRWTNERMEDLVDLVLSSEKFKKYLIFENNKRANGTHEALVDGLNQTIGNYDIEIPEVTVAQARTRFKALIGEVKALSLTKKTATGIDRSQVEKGYGDWFMCLYEIVSSRPSFNPDNNIEPEFTENTEDTNESNSQSSKNMPTNSQSMQTPTKAKKQFVPIRISKRTSQQLITERIDKIIENDKTAEILNLIKEENELSRQHEAWMMDKFLQIFSPAQPHPQSGDNNSNTTLRQHE